MKKLLTSLVLCVFVFTGCKDKNTSSTSLRTSLLPFPVTRSFETPKEPYFPEFEQFNNSIQLLEKLSVGMDDQYTKILESYIQLDPEELHRDLLGLEGKKFTIFCYRTEMDVAKNYSSKFDSRSSYSKHQEYLYSLINHQYRVAYCDEYWGGEIYLEQAISCTHDQIMQSGRFLSKDADLFAAQIVSLSGAGKLVVDNRVKVIGTQQKQLHLLLNHLIVNKRSNHFDQADHEKICFGIKNMMNLHQLQVIAKDISSRSGAYAIVIPVDQFPRMANLLSTYCVGDTDAYIKHEHAYSDSFRKDMKFWASSSFGN